MLNHVIKIGYYIVARIFFYRFVKWKIPSLFVKVTIISKLIHISSSFKNQIEYFFTSDGESVEKRVSIFPFKGNFHSIFRRIADSTFVARVRNLASRLWTLHNLRRSGSHRRGKQGDIGEHVGQSCSRKAQVDWICVRWRKSVHETTFIFPCRLLNLAKNASSLWTKSTFSLFNDIRYSWWIHSCTWRNLTSFFWK